MTLSFEDKQKTLFYRQKRLRSEATVSEIAFMRRLDAANVEYIFQKGFIRGDCYCIVDFYLPRPKKLVIEIDGGYHKTEIQSRKDVWRDRYLRGRGFRVIRITNDDVEKVDFKELGIVD